MVHYGQGSGGVEDGSPRSESRTEIWLANNIQLLVL